MEDKKELQANELNKVNGGANSFGDIWCSGCYKIFNISDAEHRKTGPEFSQKDEYKCPYCGTWNIDI